MTSGSERRSFEKQLLKSLSPKLKGSRWERKQNAIYCEVSGYYFDVLVSVSLNDFKTTVRMSAKPMSLDRLYWQITELDSNNSQLLSFRTWGAFTCSGLPVAERHTCDEGLSPDMLAGEIVEWADAQLEGSRSELAADTFSTAVARHPNQVERGAYAFTYVTSLIEEGNLDAARQTAAAYADGTAHSVSRQTHAGGRVRTAMTGRSFLRTVASLAAHPRPPPFADGPDGVQDSYPRVYPPDSALWRDDCERARPRARCGRYRTRHERADRARWRVCKLVRGPRLARGRILDRRLGLEPIRRRLTDTLDIAS